MPRVSPQLIVFTYHKSGTSLFLHVMTKVCERLGLTLANYFGCVDRLELEPDVVLLPHSILRCPLDRPYRAIRVIRDPRDIWVSGYLYHLRCDEPWCRNTDLDPTPPIGWPKVAHAFVHRSEDWKRRYIEGLNGKSYQQNLLERSTADGLDFELERYTGCTLAAMREWERNAADALDVKLEEVMADFDSTLMHIFDHFGFTAKQAAAALEVARSEDLGRMDDITLARRPQIYSRTISKWRGVLSNPQIARFDTEYADLIHTLGYAPAGSTLGLSYQECPKALQLGGANEAAMKSPFVMVTNENADVWLSADGVTLRPTDTRRGTYTFVVPQGTMRVSLESYRRPAADAQTLHPGREQRLAVNVNEIVIRSGSREDVIPADDPRLIAGWRELEQKDGGLSRWTSGSAEVPWALATNPVIVEIRCTAPAGNPSLSSNFDLSMV